ncbi:unnamed protein product [Ostreobium quekettii]|uniref:Alfin N-terminal domain-containing protein n=1 Tax=Ostreobium quekettii TaxID=121088 RepID=A0A8S1J203_9CHLO|nr:unnamed protein product [Ostreobium quekettii]|eukprot:evm.model.scf_603.2 EVM.evm.TU.scf_603.2   scf_603:10366-12710(+)
MMNDHPKTVEEIFEDFQGRRAGLLRALTDELDDFYQQCDPERENLCLYGERDGSWQVDLPAEEVPPELPEPCLGINFARDGMQKKDWLALVAVHSDSWLYAVAFYYGAKLDQNDRLKLFRTINNYATLFETVTGRASRPRTGGPGSKRKKPDSGLPAQASESPLPTGRLLVHDDITPALKGRDAELFWPDDRLWYLVQIQNINARSKSARIAYTSGETEDLDLEDIIREGHMSLIPEG